MARREKKISRALPLLLWVAPLVALVLTPLYLHAAAREISTSTNEHESTALALLLAVVGLSVGGCVADQVCAFARHLPTVILVVQLSLVLLVVILWPPLYDLADMAPLSNHAAHFLRPRSHETEHTLHEAKDLGTPENVAAPVSHAESPQQAGQSTQHGSLSNWKNVGLGYCEDGETREEFCSLHSTGVKLEECADVATKDPLSIAFDFSSGDGGCDIRFPNGVDAEVRHEPGFVWWGWGAGMANPRGFNKMKHDLQTVCYAKIKQPARETPAPIAKPVVDPGEQKALIEKGKGRWSVVLACASEGEFMVKTVKSFCDRTPAEILHEIIVVDDGSSPPLNKLLIGIKDSCNLKYMRHETTYGLMIAKQTGGDAATGEFIGFFDCHVSPNNIWHQELTQVLRSGPRRMAVPQITDLNLDTWDEKAVSQVNSKCYIDFNGNFMWFDSESDYIPIISGGLVALTRSWWIESGGFDDKMRGWGGENLDQSLRTWLCGGEILRAKSSRIAHMWRVPEDQRTSAHYKRVTGGVNNIARVAAAWFDKFADKYNDGVFKRTGHTPDVSNFNALKERLQCKPYAYFMHRFRKVYHDGAVLPSKVFKMKATQTGECAFRRGQSFGIGSCDKATWFHGSNQNHLKGGHCCSGIRHWNAMECFDRLDPTGPLAYWCDVAGHNENQKYLWEDDGLIHHPLTKNCLSVHGANMVPAPCDRATKWERIEEFVPPETITYEEEVRRLGLSDASPDD